MMDTTPAPLLPPFQPSSASFAAPSAPRRDDTYSRHNPPGRLEEDSPPRRPHPELFPDTRDALAVIDSGYSNANNKTLDPHRPSKPSSLRREITLPDSLSPDFSPSQHWEPVAPQPSVIVLDPSQFFHQDHPSPQMIDPEPSTLGLDMGFDPFPIYSYDDESGLPHLGPNGYAVLLNTVQPLENFFVGPQKAFYREMPWGVRPEQTVNPVHIYAPPPFAQPELDEDDEDDDAASDCSDGPPITPAVFKSSLPVVEAQPTVPVTHFPMTHGALLTPYTPHSPPQLVESARQDLAPPMSPTPPTKRKRPALSPPAESKTRASRPVKVVPMDAEDEEDDAAYAGPDDEMDDEEYYDDEPTTKRRRSSNGSSSSKRATKRGGGRPRPEQKHKCTEPGCNLMYARPYDRDRHVQNVHTPTGDLRDQRTCPKCHKYFSRPDALKRHTTSTARCKQMTDDDED